MNEKVKALLHRVRETAAITGDKAGTAARNAGRYAEQMVDLAKLNMRIFDLNAACAELLRSAGKLVYDAHLGRDAQEETLLRLLRELDDKHAEIAQLKERAATLRGSFSCPACATLCSRGDKFCRGCGQSLEGCSDGKP